MLEKTLAVQYEGDKAASDRFIDQYTKWDENLHGVIAANIRAQQRYRFRLFKYAALGRIRHGLTQIESGVIRQICGLFRGAHDRLLRDIQVGPESHLG